MILEWRLEDVREVLILMHKSKRERTKLLAPGMSKGRRDIFHQSKAMKYLKWEVGIEGHMPGQSIQTRP
jgi:hypothetical protein